jgi:hypothetical protein
MWKKESVLIYGIATRFDAEQPGIKTFQTGSCMKYTGYIKFQQRQDGGNGASLLVKNIGKPYTGKPYVRFDEGGLANACPLLYQTHKGDNLP